MFTVEDYNIQKKKVLEMLNAAHKPELAKIDGQHVTQIWWDGEITSQKGGDLLNKRSLHSFAGGFSFPQDSDMRWGNISKEKMPDTEGFAYVTRTEADAIRIEMARLHIMYLSYNLELC